MKNAEQLIRDQVNAEMKFQQDAERSQAMSEKNKEEERTMTDLAEEEVEKQLAMSKGASDYGKLYALAVRLMAYKLGVKEAEKEMGEKLVELQKEETIKTFEVSKMAAGMNVLVAEIFLEILHRHTQQQEENELH